MTRRLFSIVIGAIIGAAFPWVAALFVMVAANWGWPAPQDWAPFVRGGLGAASFVLAIVGAAVGSHQ